MTVLALGRLWESEWTKWDKKGKEMKLHPEQKVGRAAFCRGMLSSEEREKSVSYCALKLHEDANK